MLTKSSEFSENSIHDQDSLFAYLGGFGKFQIINTVCMLTIALLGVFNDIGFAITTAELKHRCLIPECEGEIGSYRGKEAWLSSAIPTTTGGTYDSCHRYNASSFNCSASSFSNYSYLCDSFVYETAEWTIHREDWGLQCQEDKPLLYLIGSLNMIFQVIGNVYIGYLFDKFGRKGPLVSLALFVAITGTIKSFSTSYMMMAILECLESFAGGAVFSGALVLGLEMISPSQRAVTATVLEMAFSLGEVLLGVVQYLTFNWRITIRICYMPLVIVIACYWIVPESVRWLLSQQRYDDAIEELRKIATRNGRSYPEEAVRDVINAEKVKMSICAEKEERNFIKAVWKSHVLRRRFLAVFVSRMTVVAAYYGLTLNSASLSRDKLLNFALSGVAECPGYLLAFFLMDRVGRRTTLWSSCLGCTAACVAIACLPSDWEVTSIVVRFMGKLAISASMFTSDIFPSEMFPTFMRGSIQGSSNIAGKLACIFVPQLPLLATIDTRLPQMIFAALAGIAATTVLAFPETSGCSLPSTIEEAENLGCPETANNMYSLPERKIFNEGIDT